MSAGFKYNLTPEVELEEKYDVQTGVRRRGPFVLDTTNLPVGTIVPTFVPICADLKHAKCYIVRNMKVYEAYTTGDEALTIKVAKGSFPYVGMFVGNGKKGAEVSAIDTSNSNYDLITIKAAFGANLAVGDILFEASAVGGTVQKNIANSALYDRRTIDSGINIVTLLRRAAEIMPGKLAVPFTDNDKAKLQGCFEFNE
jgi:hypothetical protein